MTPVQTGGGSGPRRGSERDHVADAAPTLERLGALMDRIGRAGWPEVHAALAGYVRGRRGVLRRGGLPFDAARDLVNLAEELDRAAGILAPTGDAGIRFGVAVEQAAALGYRVELVRWCESAESPGLLGAARGVILYGPKVIRLRADLAGTPEVLADVLEHELEHARRPDDGAAIDAAELERRGAPRELGP